MKKPLALLLLLVLYGAVMPANAQFAVIDPSNLVQNALTATRTLTQIQNQVRQLQNESLMLSNDALNLRALDFNTLARLQATLATTQQLLATAQGLPFDVGRVRQEFALLYPPEYDERVTAARMWQDTRERWQRSRDSLATTIEMQAQARTNIQSDASVLADLVARSQSAAGALQAAQATNQLLALAARQAIQTQQLALVQGRAEALADARAAAAEARAQQVRRRFQEDGVRYTPHTVEF